SMRALAAISCWPERAAVRASGVVWLPQIANTETKPSVFASLDSTCRMFAISTCEIPLCVVTIIAARAYTAASNIRLDTDIRRFIKVLLLVRAQSRRKSDHPRRIRSVPGDLTCLLPG